MCLRVGHQHSRFLSIVTHFVDYYSPFWGPIAISIVVEPKVDLHVGHQHPHFLSIVTRFVDYYSPFWYPVVFSIVVEPQGALTCWSSTIAVSADFGPFPGLLLTGLGSQSGFLDCRTLGASMCRSSTLAVLADSGRFMDYYSLIMGP